MNIIASDILRVCVCVGGGEPMHIHQSLFCIFLNNMNSDRLVKLCKDRPRSDVTLSFLVLKRERVTER